MRKARKMVRLAIDETSGVDLPANLRPDWAVIKSAKGEDMRHLLATLTAKTGGNMPTDTERLAEAHSALTKSAEDIVAKEARIAELEAALKAATPAPAPVVDDVVKALPSEVQDLIAKSLAASDAVAKAAQADADKANATLAKMIEAQADAEAIKKAAAWTNLGLDANELGKALRKAADVDPELAKSFETALTAANEQAGKTGLLKEIGSAAGAVTGGDAYGKLEAIAKAAQGGKSPEAAFADAVLANPDLYKAYLAEKGN